MTCEVASIIESIRCFAMIGLVFSAFLVDDVGVWWMVKDWLITVEGQIDRSLGSDGS
jgi:hypothetical protein